MSALKTNGVYPPITLPFLVLQIIIMSVYKPQVNKVFLNLNSFSEALNNKVADFISLEKKAFSFSTC